MSSWAFSYHLIFLYSRPRNHLLGNRLDLHQVVQDIEADIAVRDALQVFHRQAVEGLGAVSGQFPVHGAVITAHELPVTYGRWVGEGYIILDLETGTGAYKIAGGMNGGVLEMVTGIFSKLIAFFGSVSDGAIALGAPKAPISRVLGPIGSLLSVISLAAGCINRGGDLAQLIPYIVLTVILPILIGLLLAFIGIVGVAAFAIISAISLASNWFANQIQGVKECSP